MSTPHVHAAAAAAANLLSLCSPCCSVDHSMTLVEKLVGYISEAMDVLRLHEASSEASFLAKMRKQRQHHRHPSSPHLQVKTTSQC
jgi:hypothetical protein